MFVNEFHNLSFNFVFSKPLQVKEEHISQQGAINYLIQKPFSFFCIFSTCIANWDSWQNLKAEKIKTSRNTVIPVAFQTMTVLKLNVSDFKAWMRYRTF